MRKEFAPALNVSEEDRDKISKMLVTATINIFLSELTKEIKVGKIISSAEIPNISAKILQEFYWYKPEDFKLCFSNGKSGKYGKLYDSFDERTIFDWLYEYNEDRIRFFEDKNNQAASEIKTAEEKSEVIKGAAKIFSEARKELEKQPDVQKEIKSKEKEMAYMKFKQQYHSQK